MTAFTMKKTNIWEAGKYVDGRVVKKAEQTWTFPLWLSNKEPNWYPGGCGFDSWPPSVGWGPGVPVSCDVGLRWGSHPALLWLRLWLAAIAPTRPLAWELPYVAGAVLKKSQKKKKSPPPKKKQKQKRGDLRKLKADRRKSKKITWLLLRICSPRYHQRKKW